MNYLLISSSTDLSEILIISSIIKTLQKQGDNVSFVGNKNFTKILHFNTLLKLYDIDNLIINENFDVCINFSNDELSTSLINIIKSNKKLGFKKNGFYNKNTQRLYNSKYLKQNTNSNIFQLYYSLADLKWKGEGYNLSYFPKYKSNKRLIGIYIINKPLEEYILNNINIDKTTLYKIKKEPDILKKIDEINKFKQLITDNEEILHIGLALRKYVHFLSTKKSPYKMELFKSAEIYDIKEDLIDQK